MTMLKFFCVGQWMLVPMAIGWIVVHNINVHVNASKLIKIISKNQSTVIHFNGKPNWHSFKLSFWFGGAKCAQKCRIQPLRCRWLAKNWAKKSYFRCFFSGFLDERSFATSQIFWFLLNQLNFIRTKVKMSFVNREPSIILVIFYCIILKCAYQIAAFHVPSLEELLQLPDISSENTATQHPDEAAITSALCHLKTVHPTKLKSS